MQKVAVLVMEESTNDNSLAMVAIGFFVALYHMIARMKWHYHQDFTIALVISYADPEVGDDLVASTHRIVWLGSYSHSDSDSPDENVFTSTFPRYRLFHHSYAPILQKAPDTIH
ncbi:hypothetical protein Tco_0352690 [Tanacetum coccineum]